VLSRDRAGLRGQTRADIGPGEDLVVDDDPVLEEDRATIDSDEPGVDVIAVSESEGLAEADRLRADDTAPPLGLEGLPYPAADHHVQTPEVHDREVHAVVDVPEDVDLRRQHLKRQPRAVPQPLRRTTTRPEQLEDHP